MPPAPGHGGGGGVVGGSVTSAVVETPVVVGVGVVGAAVVPVVVGAPVVVGPPVVPVVVGVPVVVAVVVGDPVVVPGPESAAWAGATIDSMTGRVQLDGRVSIVATPPITTVIVFTASRRFILPVMIRPRNRTKRLSIRE